MLFKIKKVLCLSVESIVVERGCPSHRECQHFPWLTWAVCSDTLIKNWCFINARFIKVISTKLVKSMFEGQCTLAPANTLFSKLRSVQQMCEIWYFGLLVVEFDFLFGSVVLLPFKKQHLNWSFTCIWSGEHRCRLEISKITGYVQRSEGGEITKMDITLCRFAFLEQNSYISACLRKLTGYWLFDYAKNCWKTLFLYLYKQIHRNTTSTICWHCL